MRYITCQRSRSPDSLGNFTSGRCLLSYEETWRREREREGTFLSFQDDGGVADED